MGRFDRLDFKLSGAGRFFGSLIGSINLPARVKTAGRVFSLTTCDAFHSSTSHEHKTLKQSNFNDFEELQSSPPNGILIACSYSSLDVNR
jgi:hypothetical protein